MTEPRQPQRDAFAGNHEITEASEASLSGQVLQYASDAGAENLPTRSLDLPQVNPSASYEERCTQVMQCAEAAFAQTGSWVIFFREILGPSGLVRELFGGQSGRLEEPNLRRFIASEHYTTLNEMVAAIRSQDDSKSNAAEPERMITVRIPRSLHELLKEEAVQCNLSINKLAISKLLQPTNDRYVPEQRGKLRGRRPGPQPQREKGLPLRDGNASQPASELGSTGEWSHG
ncbi:MAG: hypothetical protein AAF802_10645 [Planctomycetota bacterium]